MITSNVDYFQQREADKEYMRSLTENVSVFPAQDIVAAIYCMAFLNIFDVSSLVISRCRRTTPKKHSSSQLTMTPKYAYMVSRVKYFSSHLTSFFKKRNIEIGNFKQTTDTKSYRLDIVIFLLFPLTVFLLFSNTIIFSEQQRKSPNLHLFHRPMCVIRRLLNWLDRPYSQ